MILLTQLLIFLQTCRLSKFANKETGVELLENVRGQDVYVVQTGGGDRPNDSLMELLFLINAFRLASADSITVITPFFPYRRVSYFC